MRRGSVTYHTGSLRVHPQTAVGWTHIWDGREQYPITDQQAATLVFMGYITYSPDDGPNARVYRPVKGVKLEQIKKVFASG
jgi:hypothetical protein